MPYVKRSVPQALDLIDPGVQDVYHSTNVYVNRVLVALWEPPIPGSAAMFKVPLPPDPQVSLSQSQIRSWRQSEVESRRNPTSVYNVGGGDQYRRSNQVEGTVPVEGSTSTRRYPEALGPGDTILKKIEAYLNDCLDHAAEWHAYKRSPGNPNVVNCYQTLGHNITNDSTPWCAAFAGTCLKMSGAPYIVGPNALSASAYDHYGQDVGLNPSNWRRNDILTIHYSTSGKAGTSHVTFLRGAQGSSRIQCCGGNQSGGMVTQSTNPLGGGTYIVSVRRAWPVDPEFDHPLQWDSSRETPRVGGKKTR
jgi:hypothetical protein